MSSQALDYFARTAGLAQVLSTTKIYKIMKHGRKVVKNVFCEIFAVGAHALSCIIIRMPAWLP